MSASKIVIRPMTPQEYGGDMSINYSFSPTPLGDVIVASTDKGVCYLVFADDHDEALTGLRHRFPAASFRNETDSAQQAAMSALADDGSQAGEIRLHVRGTDFQIRVWEELLKIPAGTTTTYGDIAVRIGRPRACRAVGTAVGDNPVAILIPCHRVILSTGQIGNYRWGQYRKLALLNR